MIESAERLVQRWQRRPQGRVVDVSLEMTRVTLDVLERTIFTSGLSRNPDALGRAITRYFEGLGRIDPMDIFGFPAWVPRIGRLRARPSIRFFEEMVTELIAARKASLARGEATPRDLLTLLLEASDPETGQGLSDADVNANIVTFIGAGHETTANALGWSLYLISQDENVRSRIESEVASILGSERLNFTRIDELIYTRAVIEEAMRLYPPAPFLSRAAIAADRVADLGNRPRDAGDDCSVCAASARDAVGGARCLPTGAIPARGAVLDRPVRISAVWRRPSGLHWRQLRAARGYNRSRDHRARRAARSCGRTRCRPASSYYPPTARGTADVAHQQERVRAFSLLLST